jgi:hypothetical protein
VGKGLTYLVAKDPNSGSEKTKKASALGVKVVGVDDMWAILGKPVAVTPVAAPVVARAPKKAPAPKPTAEDIFAMFGDAED